MPLNGFESIYKILMLLATLGVLVFGVYKYWESQHREKANKSLEYSERYESDDMESVRQWFLTVSIKFKEQPTTVSNDQLGQLMIKKIKEAKDRLYYDKMVGFFHNVYNCIEANGCEKKRALELLADKARSFWVIMNPVIKHFRTSTPTTRPWPRMPCHRVQESELQNVSCAVNFPIKATIQK